MFTIYDVKIILNYNSIYKINITFPKFNAIVNYL